MEIPPELIEPIKFLIKCIGIAIIFWALSHDR